MNDMFKEYVNISWEYTMESFKESWEKIMKASTEAAATSCSFKVGDRVAFKDTATGKSFEITDIDGAWVTLDKILITYAEDVRLVTPGVDNSSQYQRVDKKCTCGSSAVGSDRHSDWCDIK